MTFIRNPALAALFSSILFLFASFQVKSDNGSSGAAQESALLVIPGPDGALSTWLTLGPLSPPPAVLKEADGLAVWDPLADSQPRAVPGFQKGALQSTWKAVSSTSSRFSMKFSKAGVAYLSASLRADEETTAYLSLGCNGGFELKLNGRTIRRADTEGVPSMDMHLVALPLVQGDNELLLRVWRSRSGSSGLYARLLDTRFERTTDVAWILPGAEKQKDALTAGAARLLVEREIDPERRIANRYVWLEFPGGRTESSAAEGQFTVTAGGKRIASTISLPFQSKARERFLLGVFPFDAEERPTAFSLKFSSAAPLSAKDSFSEDRIRVLFQAIELVRSIPPDAKLPVSSVESVLWRIHHLSNLIAEGGANGRYLGEETKITLAMAKALSSGVDPYLNRRSELQRRGYRSKIDGEYHPYALYVPPGWRENEKRLFPLVISLHGLNSNPVKAMTSLFGIPLAEGETKEERASFNGQLSGVSAFVLAPEAFGNSGYYSFGERDVMDVLSIVQARYRIDPDRIYITGASMGGTGSAKIPLHYPDVFAAAMPLCGYHDVAAYTSVSSESSQPFERFLVDEISNVSWVPNGRHLPLHVVHGTKDNPRPSKTLVERYTLNGYKASLTLLELGHNVWDETYKDLWAFEHFNQYRRPASPRQLTLATWNLRYNRNRWLRVDQFGKSGEPARIDARWPENAPMEISTSNVTEFAVFKDAALMKKTVLRAVIDGQALSLEGVPSDFWRFRRSGSAWQVDGGAPDVATLRKRPGLAGPVTDAFNEPLLFVYGTADPYEGALARRVIEELRQPRGRGVTVNFKVVADVEVRAEEMAAYSLVLVGTPEGNRVLSSLMKRLPITVKDGAVELNGVRYAGETVAASFIFPNPENPSRYVVVHTGVSPRAFYHAAHLPALLPDYVIYDGADWQRDNGMLFGADRSVLKGGFFDFYWKP